MNFSLCFANSHYVMRDSNFVVVDKFIWESLKHLTRSVY